MRKQRNDIVSRSALGNRTPRQDFPLVSCICPTYNRPPDHQYLLEEAIESFLRQTYPNKELIVLNDCAGQELVCDAPGVHVVNVPARFPTLGEKRNAAHRLARGEFFAPWDDDDISLPWRLSFLVRRLGGADYLNPDKCWFRNGNGLSAEPFIGGVYPKSLFTRRAFEAVGGYPPVTFQEDVALETAMLAMGRDVAPSRISLRRGEWYYIYRAEVSPIHLSSSGDDGAYADVGNLPVQPGRYVLRPHWRTDYKAETRRFAKAEPCEATDQQPDAHAGSSAPFPTTSVGIPEDAQAPADPPVSPVVLFVASNREAAPPHPALEHFLLINRRRGQSKPAHLARVVRSIEDAMAAGGTHLLVPREHAGWLRDHPRVADYLAQHHDLAEASAETGVVFALRPPNQPVFDIDVTGWDIGPGEGIPLIARRPLVKPKLTLRPTKPPQGPLRGRIVLSTAGLNTLRVGFRVTRSGCTVAPQREIVLSLARPGNLFHTVSWVEATFAADGSVRLEFDLELDIGQSLDRIRLDLVEEDNWRLHPAFPGGTSFALPVEAPAGARLDVRELSLVPAENARKGLPHGFVRGPRPAPYRKPTGRPRDAVIFSSWVPDDGLALGDVFIETLLRYHADAKIFVGINHGSSPQWAARLKMSGLDVTIQPAAPTLTIPCDPTGFVAALDAYRRHDEPFELVWFGHTKGLSHLDDPRYATSRWMIERMFWSRRAEIERFFVDPGIGLYAPHYLLLKQSHLRQTDALQRMYRATRPPPGVAALSTHFVMRNESVRDFCAKVDGRFFRAGPEPFGGDAFFFEMGMPNLPLMQGFAPYIESGLGGTTGQPGTDCRDSIHNDWRQNHAVVALELETWRLEPTACRARHAEHYGVR